ncbi:hypothetical protein ACFQMA_20340 [Halosimplex aquaticum]|uniref:BadF-type ATPase n=1 Tax=Halosimplex aquaticum TaxID=3026162 RepID=A0ABD5Y464_9EURY|nr:hypothetical protein [Halosimplex aquaticum]
MYVGIDHSTTGIKIAGVGDDGELTTAFRIDRRNVETAEAVLEVLDERVDLSRVSLAAITYAFGDAIDEIQGIERVSNRGVTDLVGLDYGTGAGAAVFDRLREAAVPTVVVPGVHRGLDTLHEFFRHYSALAGADKVGSVRYALERFRGEFDPTGTFIWACASSSCMAGLVVDGRLTGFFHWVGPVHGWPDPEAIRRGVEADFDDVFMQCGLLPRRGADLTEVHDLSDPELFESVYWSSVLNVYALYPFARELGGGLDAVVLSGRLMRREQPFALGRRVYERCVDIAPVRFAEPYTSAQGAALVARDVAEGAERVLGIPVGDVPVDTGR